MHLFPLPPLDEATLVFSAVLVLAMAIAWLANKLIERWRR